MVMSALSIAMICVEWICEYPNGEWYIGWGYLGITSLVLFCDMRARCT